MKRTFNYLIALVITAIAMVSCLPEEDVFDETLLYGRWKSGVEYIRFDEGGTGKEWDLTFGQETYEEDEGGEMTWALVKTDLTIIRILNITGNGVPHNYTVLELTPTTLKLNDGIANDVKIYNKVKTFNKSFIIGKWRSGNDYFRFDEDGKGKSWNIEYIVEEEKGNDIKWTLNYSDLTIIWFQTVGGDGVAYFYTVTELTPSLLKLDNGFETKIFSKVN